MTMFQGKTAVVTGAASGIGLALAHRLAREGANIVLADVEPAPLEAATRSVRERGVEAIGVRTDVSDSEQVEALASTALSTFGKVHVLVNNAGVGCRGRAWELSEDDWRWVVDVCFWGVVHGIRSFVPGMIAHGENAYVVNTSSMMGLGTAPMGGPYQAAKHAVTAVSEGLQFDLREVAPQIKVTLLCPGYADTAIGSAARNRQARFGGPVAPAATSAPKAQPRTAVRVPPEVIADLAIDAVREGRFYALADWGIWRPLVQDRFDAIIDQKDPVVVRLPD
jgi:NAD(P)-dependent dehydrogenase (short-subunit alcohol dehydrogenase family)